MYILIVLAVMCDELRRPADTEADNDWTFNVLVCLLSVTERFLLQQLVCGTVFHHMSLLSLLSLHHLLSS